MPRKAPTKEAPVEPEAVVPEPTEVPEGDEPMPDAVLVMKVIGEDGSITAEPQPLGNVQPTEVQTLLELGLKRWRLRIGLSD